MTEADLAFWDTCSENMKVRLFGWVDGCIVLPILPMSIVLMHGTAPLLNNGTAFFRKSSLNEVVSQKRRRKKRRRKMRRRKTRRKKRKRRRTTRRRNVELMDPLNYHDSDQDEFAELHE